MAKKILMPASGQNALESAIVRWRVAEGDSVRRGDVLLEIETDKATMAVESYASGTVLKILHQEGESVAAGETVAYIGEAGETPEADAPAKAGAQAKDDNDDDYRAIVKKPEAKAGKTSAKPVESPEKHSSAVHASPKARHEAKATGKNVAEIYRAAGRTVKFADVKAYSDKEPELTAVPLTKMRRTIAERMLQSVGEAPQFTVSIESDMTAFIDLRKKINEALEAGEGKVSINDMLIKAVCIAVKAVPGINSKFTAEAIHLFSHVHIGVAVALPQGLVVPVIRNAESLPLKEISRASADLIKRVKSDAAKPEELSGGTITVSNLGMLGINRFTAIINPPESAILAVGGIVEKPAAVQGQVTVRPMMDITATFDHRVIDGYVGAQFMAELKRIIESPLNILL